MKLIQQSPFINQYGSLDLMENDAGEVFLVMGDCFGPDVFGPLTADQVNAFELLCEAKPASLGAANA